MRALASAALVALLALAAPAAAQICTPQNIAPTTADLIDRGDGTVYQPGTGLEWKKCIQGTSWFPGTNYCYQGGPTLFTWGSAIAAARSDGSAGGGWRVPNVKELLALVEASCTGPAIDTIAFPSTPPGLFWASSAGPSAAQPDAVDFSMGLYAAVARGPNELHYLRLVRGGRSGASFNADVDFTPAGLTFPDRYWAPPGAIEDSLPYVVTGIGQRVLAAIASCTSVRCEFSVNDGPFSTAPREVDNGDVLVLRQQAAAAAGASAQLGFRLGGAQAAWRVFTTGQALITNAPVLPAWTVGRSGYSTWLMAANGTPTYAFVLVAGQGGLPPGLALAPSGLLSGTPTAAGSYGFTVRVTDSGSPPTTSTQAFTLTVNPPLAITTTSLPDARVGVFQVPPAIAAAGGTPPVKFAVTSGALPPGVTLFPSGMLVYLPTAAGVFAFTVTATDAVGATAAQPLSIRVTTTTGTALSSSSPSVPAGSPFQLTATVVANGTTPDGQVAFRNGAAALPGCSAVPLSPIAFGVAEARCTVSTLGPGAFTLTAEYLGGTVTLGSRTSIEQTITPVAGTPCAGFTDVDAADPFCPNVDWVRNRAITLGCGAGLYCPRDAVVRLGMAAFMNRIGTALGGDGFVRQAASGALDLDANPVVCATDAALIAGFPRRVQLDAVFSARASADVGLAADLLASLDGGTTWQLVTGPGNRGFARAGRWTQLHTLGYADLEVGQSVRFAIGVSRGGDTGSADLDDSTCHLRVRVGNRDTTYTPYDDEP